MSSPSLISPKFLPTGNDLGIVAVGFSGGQCKPGVDAAPSALIDAGLLTQLSTDLGFALHYDGAVQSYKSILPSSDPDHRNMKRPLAVSAVTERLSEQVYEHASQGRCVLTLGGDHSVAIGSIAGVARAIRERHAGRELAVIWVDAHADINTPETSSSGNIHGMPVAFLTGLARSDRPDIFGWLQPDQLISLKKLVYIGLRDVDPGEKRILREHGIRAFSMHDIDKHGIGKVMEMALGHIGADTPIHLSFDVDALDPLIAPSTGTPVRGGLTLREGDYICECVHDTGSLVGLDLVEVNPSLGDDSIGAKETIRAGCSLVRFNLPPLRKETGERRGDGSGDGEKYSHTAVLSLATKNVKLGSDLAKRRARRPELALADVHPLRGLCKGGVAQRRTTRPKGVTLSYASGIDACGYGENVWVYSLDNDIDDDKRRFVGPLSPQPQINAGTQVSAAFPIQPIVFFSAEETRGKEHEYEKLLHKGSISAFAPYHRKPPAATMKALQLTAPRSPLVINDIEKPVPGPGQLLVRSVATAINPVDSMMHDSGLLVVGYPTALGCDASGIVVELGSGVAGFKVGDRFLMDAPLTIPTPKNISMEQAATLGVGTYTAGLGLFAGLHMPFPDPTALPEPKDEWVIIFGGAGSVGQYAVQIAKANGYKVLATCSSQNDGLLKSLGATATTSYALDQPTQLSAIKSATNGSFSRVFDAAGHSVDLAAKALTELSTVTTGKYFSTIDDWSPMQQIPNTSTYRISLGPIGRDGQDELNGALSSYVPVIARLVEAGVMVPNGVEVVGEGLESVKGVLGKVKVGGKKGVVLIGKEE